MPANPARSGLSHPSRRRLYLRSTPCVIVLVSGRLIDPTKPDPTGRGREVNDLHGLTTAVRQDGAVPTPYSTLLRRRRRLPANYPQNPCSFGRL